MLIRHEIYAHIVSRPGVLLHMKEKERKIVNWNIKSGKIFLLPNILCCCTIYFVCGGVFFYSRDISSVEFDKGRN